jgi:hypothetical protein
MDTKEMIYAYFFGKKASIGPASVPRSEILLDLLLSWIVNLFMTCSFLESGPL